MIDIQYQYAQWSTNVNISGMNWQTYHKGKWFNPQEETYDQAIEQLKIEVSEKIASDHPHLTAYGENGVEKPKQTPVEYGKSLADQLESCRDIKTLVSYKFIVRGKPEQEIYNAMVNKLLP